MITVDVDVLLEEPPVTAPVLLATMLVVGIGTEVETEVSVRGQTVVD